MSYAEYIIEDARLRILQALSREPAGRLGDAMVEKVLEANGIDRSRAWIRTQMHALAERGAAEVVVDTPATLVIALTPAGLDHVKRRGMIEGVKRPEIGEK